MESTLQGMQAQNNPMVQHYQNQVNLVKQRVDQMGDMYIGYTAAISVSSCTLSRPHNTISLCLYANKFFGSRPCLLYAYSHVATCFLATSALIMILFVVW